ncbi:peptide-N(4)-(N-acetyl-beta-glucosaminyl)asparagine amidase isoform X1 [Cynara cardunculus var. scolymus]|uniref:Transglutaminase-like protein n=2 Tax=Cynara cardunculus var. scolymus TaxID=59895 RepID=A0A103XK36_CYNCS|nr:peptide-N(4)-(N-acetyl-beta-glucosaminyl)asparagine amidase isoform X1 [Cynara cardunculus var. scolymus]KVH92225.1 Transglutaminase-like protein [Cynara cardunculus var. scolymus]
MVAKKFLVHYQGSNFDVDYETEDGFEVFKFQLFSLSAVPPDQQKIFGGADDRIVSDDSDLMAISDKLRLVSIQDGNPQLDSEIVRSDEELARMLQAEEEALMFQQFTATGDNRQFEQRVRPYVDQVLLYEDPHRQEAARNTVPVEKLEEKALVALAKEGNLKPSKSKLDHAFLLQLLFWFKQTFKWVNSPPCEACGSETANQGMGVASSSETAYGASRVELYRCNICPRITRFPRYNDPIKLLETKKGRCGEWANCFSLYCRSFGYETRLILDFTDHVWTECYSMFLGRWMHLDPCEGIYDTPLLYEKGWNKKLSYTIAIARDGVHDVTKRYTRKWHEVLSRRNITTETAASSTLTNITRECRKNLTSVISALEERDRKEVEELDKNLHSQDDDSLSLPGRLSGDKEWRALRSEIGSDSLSSSSCPVRKCIDEHVSSIYNAFSPLISRLTEFSSKNKALEGLHFVRGVLVDLKKSPFKTRRVVIDSNLKDAKFFIRELWPSFNLMLDALSLKSNLEANEKVEICVADEPVRTSMALPVVFHALDDVLYNIKHCNELSKSSLSWPLLKLNRICCGSVLASGEELPFGIATSAFDGTRLSKWEEPNGSKGCWLIYKAMGVQAYELCSYELMSANDAPERDPKDWVIEGSDDGGSSWRVLDEQTSQMFHNRFQRKTYTVKLQGFFANVFRFRFLTVRDGQATSRFQIGSIDLYASSNSNVNQKSLS